MKRFLLGLLGFVVVWIAGLAPQFLTPLHVSGIIIFALEGLVSIAGYVYAEIFTEHELMGMIAFFKGPVGGKWIEKQRELQEKLAKRMRDFLREAESKSGRH